MENGVSRKRQVLSSRSSYANQKASTQRTKGRSTKVRSEAWQLAPPVQKILPIFLKNHDFLGRLQKAFFASISTPSPVREKSPPINPNQLSIYTRMPSIRKIVGLFFEISSKIAYNRYSMGGRLLRARSGPLPPPRMIQISQKETAT